MLCKKCGCEIPDGSKVCSYCGNETAILKEEKKRKAKKQAKWGCLAIVVMFILLVASCMSSLGDAREELYTPTGTQIKAVFDGDGYSGVSVDEMKAKMGKPQFVNKVTDGIYPVTMYTYCKKDFMYEFHVYEGNVVKVTMHPEGEFKVQKIRSYDTFATLGIMPSKDVYTSATALARKKFSEVSNKVFAVDLIISESNKIDMVHIIYDKRFDTPTK